MGLENCTAREHGPFNSFLLNKDFKFITHFHQQFIDLQNKISVAVPVFNFQFSQITDQSQRHVENDPVL